MDTQQDWTAVYPSAMPFRPGAVPLPVRMGYPMRGTAPPEKKGNLELVKVSASGLCHFIPYITHVIFICEFKRMVG